MPDVFISYSRRDQDFVRRLAAELESRGKDAWVDWEDIPPTADWLARIKTGIEEADTVVFVISPDSIASAVCGQEVSHATALGKRIVPVLLRKVEPKATPGAVAAHNWISFADGASFEQATDTLVAAVETDLPWVESHTRWLVEAREWEEHDRDRSFLLRGSELSAAEAWLATGHGADKDPPVTPLQYEHILASRRASSRRTRVIAAAVSIALIAAIGLSILALIERNNAIDQREQATARELIANSALTLDTDPELSVALAARSAEIRSSPESEEALRRALNDSFARQRIAVPGRSDPLLPQLNGDATRALAASDGVARLYDVGSGKELRHFDGAGADEGAQLSPDGARVLTKSGESEAVVRLYDAATGKLEHTLDPGDPGIIGARFSDDGRRVVTSAPQGLARVWDAETGERIAELDGGDDPLVNATFLPGGDRVATGDGTGHLVVWDVATGRRLLERRVPDFVRAEVTPDGSKLVGLVGEGGSAYVYALPGGRRLSVLRGAVPSNPQIFALSRDGELAVTGWENGQASVWRLSDGDRLHVLQGHRGFVTATAISPDGELAATAGGDGTIRIFEPRSGQGVAVLRGHRGGVNGLSFSADGSRLASVGADGDLRVWQPGPPGVTGSVRDVPLGSRAATAGGMGPAGVVAVGDDHGGARLVDVESGRRVAGLESLGGAVRDIGFVAGGRRVVAAGDEEVVLADARTGRGLASVEHPGNALASAAGGPRGDVVIARWADGTVLVGRPGKPMFQVGTGIEAAALTPDGASAAVAGGGEVALVDLRTEKPKARARVRETATAMQVAVAPRGDRVLVGANEDLDLLDRRLKVLRRIPGGEKAGLISDVAFSHDGRLMAAAYGDGPIRIWRTSGGAALQRFDQELAAYAVAFSPDDRFVLTAGDEGWSRVWDVDSGEALLRVRGRNPTWSADGRRLSTVDDGVVRVWECEVCRPLPELLRLADARVTRPLSDAERERYLSGD